jgi:hypothetical protein
MNQHRAEILRRLDVQAEFLKFGVRVAKGAVPDAKGWLKCHSLYSEDKNPSASINVGDDPNLRGIYHDFILGLSKSLFDISAEFGPDMTGWDAYFRYARETGVKRGGGGGNGKAERPGPTLLEVEAFQKDLLPEVRQYLHEKRGFTDESIAKFQIGWCTNRERNTFPVYEATSLGPKLVNIRFHNSKKDPKTLNWAGHGKVRLWGVERLVKCPPGSTVIITEGEFDAMLAEQETGFVSVSGTNGAGAFQSEWVQDFHGHHIILLYDADQPGRDAVHKLVLPAFKDAVTTGKVLSLKIVWLYENADKDHKDVTDWIIKDGGSGEALKKLIQDTPPFTYPTAVSHLPEPIELKDFAHIDRSENAGKRVTVNLQVYGENTVAYYAARKIKITHCQLKKEAKCSGPGKTGRCQGDIEVPLGDRVLIAGVRATDSQFKNLLRDYVCDKDRRPALHVEDTDKEVVRECYAHQIFEPMKSGTQIDKVIYVIGGDLVDIGKYRATGRIVASYRDQQPVLLVDTLEHQEEDYQCFDLDTARPHLEKLKAMKVDDMVEDLSLHVTRIYKRHDLHLGILLVLCSPLWINFPGDGRIRGWLTAVMVGDTGTGKTTISQGLFEFARIGDRVSGLTASRTGIVYGMDHDERKGWRVKAGALLKMSRQALIIDEAQDIPVDQIKTSAEGLDTGIIKINRIQHRTFESTTRTIFSCNPKDPKNSADQRGMSTFDHGCQAVMDIFPQMLLRRIDLFLFASSGDIENKEEIFNPPQDIGEPQMTDEDLRALIFFAWNLKEEQVVISSAVATEIRRESLKLSQVFGCDNPPIVYPEDFRKTLARLSVAVAILDLSTNEDFTQVIVYPGHVYRAADFVDSIYRAENCRLHKHSKEFRKHHALHDQEEIKKELEKLLLESGKKRDRALFILGLLRSGQRFKQTDLEKTLGCVRMTIIRSMEFFADHGLVATNRFGCKKTPKLSNFLSRLEKEDSALSKLLDAEIEKVKTRMEEESEAK